MTTAGSPDPILVAPMTTSPVPLIGGRYRLGRSLGRGGMGNVFQAEDRLTGTQVALKQVIGDTEMPVEHPVTIADPRFMLAQEFQALSSLRHPNIVGVLDYGFDEEGHPYFTMDLVPQAQTIIEAGRDQPLDARLDLLVQMLQAVAYIHRRGFIHRDLKPGNVLVTPGGADDERLGTVKVLDFGLSAELGGERMAPAGTLAYMAPEMIIGQPASMASDLFALGVMAYELLTGRHPFTELDAEDSTPSGQMVQRILTARPRTRYLTPFPKLGDIVLGLMAKEPENRYPSATAVIEAINRATGKRWAVETEATRESFLQAASFVGRQQELMQLSEALEEVMAGRGSSWLVGGESGVGKSRLVNELRTLALVRGATVLRGQAIRDAGSPYILWRPVLRRLLLITSVDGRAAAILKPIIPDIEALLGFNVDVAPELDPKMAQIRLLAVIGELFQAQSTPLVIVLEDLQWASAESLTLLAELNGRSAERPLFILGNYRDDEAPDLPGSFPGAQLIKLDRLTEAEIARLSQSMLGPEGNRPSVIELLQRETEGNPFFLVEVVRTLAEEAGQLENVAVMTLPQHVFSGGVQRLIQRRLEQVPVSDQSLLRLAAVAGRFLDLPVIEAAAEAAQINLEQWLTNCANAAVLDVQDQQWRFAHDKLREGLLAGLSTEQRRELHRQVALAYEATYADRPDQAAVLAYHWAEAGNQEREQSYAAIAGGWALRSGAYQEAVDFLTRALALARQQPQNEVLLSQAEQLHQGRLTRQLGQAYLAQGNLVAGRANLEAALAILGRPVPGGPVKLGFSLLGQLFRQIGHRLQPGYFLGRGQAARDNLLESAWAYERLSEIYYFANEIIMFGNATLAAVNVAESAGPSPELARSYGNLGIATGAVPLHRVAEAYLYRGRETAKAVGDPGPLAWVLLLTGVYGAGVGQWEAVREAVGESVRLSEMLGDRRYWEVGLAVMALAETYQGQCERSLTLFGEEYPSSKARGDIQSQTWGVLGSLQNLIILDRLTGPETDNFIEAMNALFTEELGLAEQTYAYGVMALVHWRRGNQAAAHKLAALGAPLIAKAMPTSFYSVAGYMGTAEVLLSMWAASGGPASGDRLLRRQVRQACFGLAQFARVFPVGRPRAWLAWGRYDWLAGRSDRAFKRWRRSLASAQKLGMPYEEGLAHYYIGRYLEPEKSLAGLTQGDHLTRAKEIFDHLGAGYELAQMESEQED